MLNLTTKQSHEIYLSQFQVAANEVVKGEHGNPDSFRNIKCMYLGKLCVKNGRKKYFIGKKPT